MSLLKNVHWVKVAGRPTRYSYMSYEEKPDRDMQDYYTFLLIPGNPGNDIFYENFGQQFVQEISKKQTGSASMYTISHLNHVPKDKGCSTAQQERFNLSEQIEHKLDFCREHLSKDRSVHLVGHSIGAYICLRMIDQLKKEGWSVSGCYCLFPAVERMAKTPSGQRVTPLIQAANSDDNLIKFVNEHHYLAHWLTWCLKSLPHCLKHWITRMAVGKLAPECVVKGAIELVDPLVLANISHMAKNELEIVTTFDETMINPANKHLIHFYYGVDDGWSPLNWSDRMRERLPTGRVFVDKAGCEHAFVVNHSEVMAIQLGEMVADHMINYALGND